MTGAALVDGLELQRPWVLWLVPLLTVSFVWLRLRALSRLRRAHAPAQFHDPVRSRRWLRWLRLAGEALLVVTVVVALAGPERSSRLELSGEQGADVLLVLDISLSMLAADFEPNRLDALRRMASDFISRSGGNRLGIVAFAADAYTQSPLTANQAVLQSILDGIDVYAVNQNLSGGTAVGTALLVGGDLLERSRVDGRDRAIILITDGESNRGADPILAARFVRELGIRTYIVGVGGLEPVSVTFEGAPVGTGEDPYLAVLDDAQLVAISDAADGVYIRAAESAGLEEIFSHLARLESAPLNSRWVTIRRAVVGPFAAAALALFSLSLFLNGLTLRRPFR